MDKNNKGGYGLLSLMAMIIGIVIGSGIFVKNAGLIETAGSVGMVAISWLIGALLIISLVIAFIEIISMTEIAGEQSTVTNWGRRLVGIRFGKFVGIYLTLAYFPVIMAGLFQFASDSFLHTLSYTITSNHDDSMYTTLLNDNPMGYEMSIIAIAIGFLLLIMVINALLTKPGKYFQNIGTTIKTLPLLFVIIVFVVMLFMGDVAFASNSDLINATDIDGNPINDVPTIDSFGAGFKAIMLTMPGVLFAFDGFLLAGALSREAKEKSTFKNSFIFSMIFIIAIYLTYSLAVLGLGDWTTNEHGAYGTISNSIYATFDSNVASVIDPIITGIIWLSILTGVSGCSIASYRMMADMSVQNIIKDENGTFIKKNKNGVNNNGAIIIIMITIAWFVLGSLFDTILVSQGLNPLTVVGFSTNMIVVWAYFIYTIIIVGAMVNRFTKKNYVEKNKMFWPAAVISVILTTLITSIFALSVLLPSSSATGMEKWLPWFLEMIYTLIYFAFIFIVYWLLWKRTGKASGLTEATDELIKEAKNGDKEAKKAIELINNKNIHTAAYFGITVEELAQKRQEVKDKIAQSQAKIKNQE